MFSNFIDECKDMDELLALIKEFTKVGCDGIETVFKSEPRLIEFLKNISNFITEMSADNIILFHKKISENPSTEHLADALTMIMASKDSKNTSYIKDVIEKLNA